VCRGSESVTGKGILWGGKAIGQNLKGNKIKSNEKNEKLNHKWRIGARAKVNHAPKK
jgi:hypothetical protein